MSDLNGTPVLFNHARRAVGKDRPTGHGRGVVVRRPPAWLVVSGIFAAGSFALCCYQLATPKVLFGVYDGDDGVYFGASVRLIHGVVPYRDYTLLHPPGIALLLAPLALLSHLTGTQVALGLARILTALVTAANVVLIGAIARRRSLFATAVAAGALALFPEAVAADNTVLLEPYLVAFCLIGVLVSFSGERIATARLAFAGGIAFGLAGAVKIWAIFPVVVAVVVIAATARDRLVRFALGVLVGFAIPAGPFIALAPRAFLHDVVVTQFARGASGTAGAGVASRLFDLTGFSGIWPVQFDPHEAVVFAAVVALGAVAAFVPRGRTPLEWFALGAAAVSVGALLGAASFYNHYAYFSAPFLALLAALLADRARAALASRLSSRPVNVAAVGIVVAVALVLYPSSFRFSSAYLAASDPIQPAPLIDRVVPPGACLLSVDVVFALVADRFTASEPGCPAMDDSFGTWIALDPDRPPPSAPPYPSALVSTWRAWLERADYLLYEPYNQKIPFTPSLLSWFNDHYQLVANGTDYEVFANRSRVSDSLPLLHALGTSSEHGSSPAVHLP